MLRNPPNTQGQCWVVMKSLVIVRFAGGKSSGFEFFLVRRGATLRERKRLGGQNQEDRSMENIKR